MTSMTTTLPPLDSLAMLLRGLKLPAFVHHAEEVEQKAQREGWTFGHYLHHRVGPRAGVEAVVRRHYPRGCKPGVHAIRTVPVHNEVGCFLGGL